MLLCGSCAVAAYQVARCNHAAVNMWHVSFCTPGVAHSAPKLTVQESFAMPDGRETGHLGAYLNLSLRGSVGRGHQWYPVSHTGGDAHDHRTSSGKFASDVWTQHCFLDDVGPCPLQPHINCCKSQLRMNTALTCRCQRSSCDGRWGVRIAEQLLVQVQICDPPDRVLCASRPS